MTQGTGPAEALEWGKGAEEGEEQEAKNAKYGVAREITFVQGDISFTGRPRLSSRLKWKYFSIQWSTIAERALLLECSQGLPVRPSGRRNT
jgi:hypothetical protein